ncbi:hypothetical protein ACJJIU_13125 [Microbulbifer sp. CnH-101-E]|uniref:hypothetical protein n=1 Tax=unclassified Microbulbifer TaxID=2619833 RepID=UPI00403A03A7
MRIFLTSLFVLVLSACGSNMPAPSVSEYVKTEGGGFLMERNAGVKYAMIYTLLKPSESATSYKAVFESTIPNGRPVYAEGAIEPGTLELQLQSPVIPGVKNNQTYSVSLTLFAGETQLTTHNDQVKFSLPSNMLSQFGVAEH